MLRYVGGKTRLAKDIADVIKQHIQPQHIYYYEPFFGGGSMAPYTKDFGLVRCCSDVHQDLINMYKMLQLGWLPPLHVTEQEYNELKRNTDTNMQISALRGYVGHAMAFAGKWFDTFARDKQGKRKFDEESYRRLLKGIPDIQDIIFRCTDYRFVSPISSECIIYCDPPYAGTTMAYDDKTFDHDAFWFTMQHWSNTGAVVLISEYTAPDDFTCVWEKPYKTYGITLGATKDKIERLFTYGG